MKKSEEQDPDCLLMKKKLLYHLGDGPRRLSTYRMFKSRQFVELCEFYWEGIGISRFEQFAAMARRLERTFEP